ncbi:Uncharacterized integral membrane protein [Amycolatopsis arida]|uniref:Uncharacterized integral membrane protein n=1 Tax=Amycolatopsis arida TaxID=587909 RepID=A0A1I5QVH1_9PSEU|nr:lipopolysaccharide assembly protein LapA domain-containing protein [Amycolatopsis arida]TDX98977.1 putative integral membrane protein [Amycolatopsis arida]SFP50232.1 Uncharacterized integral membrane protein [Amycolatopsis arida]
MTHAEGHKWSQAGAGGEPAAPEPGEPPRTPDTTDDSAAAPAQRSRISGAWVAVIVAMVVLIVLLVFILQNLNPATVHFLGLSGSLPLAVAMLFSAIAGGLLVALIGGARIMQLRKETKAARRQAR